jgi:hypothetical protein
MHLEVNSQMRTTQDSLERLAGTSAHLRQALDRAKADAYPDLPLPTLTFADLGRVFSSSFHDLTDAERRAVGDCVEDILRDGDDSAKNAVATGFIEAVVSWTDSHPDVRDDIRSYLGVEAINYWRAWNLFTTGEP